jgi:hypothetical protein
MIQSCNCPCWTQTGQQLLSQANICDTNIRLAQANIVIELLDFCIFSIIFARSFLLDLISRTKGHQIICRHNYTSTTITNECINALHPISFYLFFDKYPIYTLWINNSHCNCIPSRIIKATFNHSHYVL